MSEILLKGMPFDAYLETYKIFEKTMQFMMECLGNWYGDARSSFRAICGQITKQWWTPISFIANLLSSSKIICLNRFSAISLPVWIFWTERAIMWQFTPHSLTLTATELVVLPLPIVADCYNLMLEASPLMPAGNCGRLSGMRHFRWRTGTLQRRSWSGWRNEETPTHNFCWGNSTGTALC